MSILSDKNAGIFTKVIEIGQFFGTEPSEFFIKLREPTTEETFEISKSVKKTSDNKEEFDQTVLFLLVPKCIIDHNFEVEASKKMSTQDVWSEIMRRAACSTYVIEQWTNSLPLAQKSKVNSEE